MASGGARPHADRDDDDALAAAVADPKVPALLARGSGPAGLCSLSAGIV